MKTKTCTRCGETKPLSEFHKRKKSRDGYRGQCKKCRNAGNPEYHAANRKRRNANSRKYYASDPEGQQARSREYQASDPDKLRNNYLKRTYGITLADYDEILDSQDGGCAICGATTADSSGTRLHVDHNHSTGEVRGLLCYNCNRGIGHFQGSTRLLRSAANYLEGRR